MRDDRVGDWQGAVPLEVVRDFRCGYCGREVSASFGYEYGAGRDPVVALCPRCASPTLLEGDKRQIPGALPGSYVEFLPADVELLYLEARLAVTAGAYTGSVMLCRKILAYVAVQKGAATGKSFFETLTFLVEESYLPPSLRSWLEYVRLRANEAHHEISVMNRADALAIIGVLEALLRFVYELPNQLPYLPELNDPIP